MKMIPDINLPSNPGVVVRMREATVSDSIDFAGIQDGMEETVTTLFLERLQDKATYTDPKKWTGEDRRLALFWYWMHTTEEFDPALEFTCSVCGEDHTTTLDLRTLSDGYTEIKGKPERDITVGDTNIIVRPLSGEALEEIEMLRLKLIDAVERDGSRSGSAKVLDARLRLLQFMLSIEFADEKSSDNPRAFREAKILSMGQKEFTEIADKVESALKEMEHGLPSQVHNGRIYLLSEPIKCLKPGHEKEVGTQVRLPFRNIDYIPRV